jgi:hypothetical protein
VPSKDEHLDRAQDNEALANSLDLNANINVDWAITILFYAALHYVDAFLAVKSHHPPNHDSRDSEIQTNGSLSVIYSDYRRLKDRSIAARYGCANFHRNQFPPIKAKFENIKLHILAKLH